MEGVIGAKPPHLLPADERDKVVQKKEMYIDIGASSKEEVEQAGVRLGDPVVPQARFPVLAGGKTYLSKAFDDRVGVALMIQALEALKTESHPNTVCGVATVMEEVGVRGATTSVEAVNPDAAIVLESDIAGDVPGITEDQSAVKLGKGPTVILYDARMIPNLRLRDLVMDTAREPRAAAADFGARGRRDRRRGDPPAQDRRADGGDRRRRPPHPLAQRHHPPRRLRRGPETGRRRPAQARRRHRRRIDRLRIPHDRQHPQHHRFSAETDRPLPARSDGPRSRLRHRSRRRDRARARAFPRVARRSWSNSPTARSGSRSTSKPSRSA